MSLCLRADFADFSYSSSFCAAHEVRAPNLEIEEIRTVAWVLKLSHNQFITAKLKIRPFDRSLREFGWLPPGIKTH